MFFRFFILGAMCLPCVLSVAYGQDYCQDVDPNLFDPNCFLDDPVVLDNGTFEQGCSSLNTYDFLPPLCWTRSAHPDSIFLDDCYAGLHESLAPEGTPWSIDSPTEGTDFLVLTTGDMKRSGTIVVNSREIKGATISQKVYLTEGDVITGDYFFGTKDYTPYNDWGRIYLKLNTDDPNDYPGIADEFEIRESFCNVESIQSYRSTKDISPETGGWISFSHVVEPNQVGPYTIFCEVVDHTDTVYDSYYAIDNLRICRGGIRPADLTMDCKVNLEDFAVISSAWLAFCPDDPNGFDPNDIDSDPNIPCQLADIDNSWVVDVNDLSFLTDDWLFSDKIAIPAFKSDPIQFQATINTLFQTDLVPRVHCLEPDELSFAIIDGPDWLTLSESGMLSGTPTETDVGNHIFTIQVDDGNSAPAETTVIISVADTDH